MAQPADQRGRLVLVPRPEAEDRELVAADARDRVALADDVLESAGKADQYLVTCAVAADVVDLLEPVQVERDDGERLPGPARAAKSLLDALVEQHAVRQTGQWVTKGERLGRPHRAQRQERQDTARGDEHRPPSRSAGDVREEVRRTRTRRGQEPSSPSGHIALRRTSITRSSNTLPEPALGTSPRVCAAADLPVLPA